MPRKAKKKEEESKATEEVAENVTSKPKRNVHHVSLNQKNLMNRRYQKREEESQKEAKL